MTKMADGGSASALQLILRCATDLKNVNLLSPMEVFALVSISGDKDNKVKTPTDRHGGSNPTWDFPIRLAVDEAALRQSRLTLQFKLVCERALGDKDVGHVHVSLKDLLDYSSHSPSPTGWSFVCYQVTKPSGRPKGHLTFSYRFTDQSTLAQPPPPPQELICRSLPVAYPVVEMDSEVCEEPMAKLDFNRTVYPPPGKISEESSATSTAAYPVVELDSKYPPVVELNSNSAYPPEAKTYLEPTAARSVVEFHSNAVYPPLDVCGESMALGLDSNLVYLPPAKVYRELPPTVYHSVELDSSSCVYPPAAKVYEEPMSVHPPAPAGGTYRDTRLYPAIEGIKGGYPPPVYGYQSPAAAYNVYPTASRKNTFGMEIVGGGLIF